MSTIPTYVIDRNNRFGGQQADYELRTEMLVTGAAGRIQEARENHALIGELFASLIKEFSHARRDLAQDHSTPNAHLFGRLRTEKDAVPIWYTILNSTEYADCNLEY